MLCTMLGRSAAVALAVSALGPPATALAGPPLITDDAATLDSGTCQFEVEHRRYRGRTESDALPACNLFADTEVSLGWLRVATDGAPRGNSLALQAKRVLVPADEERWGVGISLGNVRAAGRESGMRQASLTGLFTRLWGAHAVHLNVGAVRDHEAPEGTRRRRATWGAAVEGGVSDRLTLVAEVFGHQGIPAAAQAGLRWWVVPRHVQLTTSLGVQRGLGSEGRWASLAVRFESGDWSFR